jgi:hypothetical protein
LLRKSCVSETHLANVSARKCDLRFCLSGGIRVEPPVCTQGRVGTFRTTALMSAFRRRAR